MMKFNNSKYEKFFEIKFNFTCQELKPETAKFSFNSDKLTFES